MCTGRDSPRWAAPGGRTSPSSAPCCYPSMARAVFVVVSRPHLCVSVSPCTQPPPPLASFVIMILSWYIAQKWNSRSVFNFLRNLMLFGDLNGKKIQKRGGICICIVDVLCSTAETNNIVKQLCSNKKCLKKQRLCLCPLFGHRAPITLGIS